MASVPLFQSTPPARGATSWRQTARNLSIFQSTPPARGATRRPGSACQRCRISIHAPREGGDHRICANKRKSRGFQSTPPARGATDGAICRRRSMGNFNPRPPRGGRPGDALHGVQPAVISIHAPREGGDPDGGSHPSGGHDFNPRPPRGGRLHRGGQQSYRAGHFNPRPPRGGRLLLLPPRGGI